MKYDHDDYPTPDWVFERFLETSVGITVSDHANGGLLDPTCGDGRLFRLMSRQYLVHPSKMYGADIQQRLVDRVEYADTVSCLDVLQSQPPGLHQARVAMTNPPFSLAQDLLLQLMQSTSLRYIVLLLRLNWLGGAQKLRWLKTAGMMPQFVFVLPNRPQFRPSKKTGKWGSDTGEYGWFVWSRESGSCVWPPRFSTELSVLASTPKEVRLAQRKELWGS